MAPLCGSRTHALVDRRMSAWRSCSYCAGLSTPRDCPIEWCVSVQRISPAFYAIAWLVALEFGDHGGLSIGTCKASSLKSTGWRPRRGNVTGRRLALPASWSITASSLSMICRAHDLGRRSLAVLDGLMGVVNCREMTEGDRAARRAGVWPADLAANCQTRRRSTGCLAHRDGRVFWVTSTARA